MGPFIRLVTDGIIKSKQAEFRLVDNFYSENLPFAAHILNLLIELVISEFIQKTKDIKIVMYQDTLEMEKVSFVPQVGSGLKFRQREWWRDTCKVFFDPLYDEIDNESFLTFRKVLTQQGIDGGSMGRYFFPQHNVNMSLTNLWLGSFGFADLYRETLAELNLEHFEDLYDNPSSTIAGKKQEFWNLYVSKIFKNTNFSKMLDDGSNAPIDFQDPNRLSGVSEKEDGTVEIVSNWKKDDSVQYNGDISADIACMLRFNIVVQWCLHYTHKGQLIDPPVMQKNYKVDDTFTYRGKEWPVLAYALFEDFGMKPVRIKKTKRVDAPLEPLFVTPSSTPTPSISPTVTPSITVSPSVTSTPERSPSATPTVTPSISISPTVTPTVTVSPSEYPKNFISIGDYSKLSNYSKYNELLKFKLQSKQFGVINFGNLNNIEDLNEKFYDGDYVIG